MRTLLRHAAVAAALMGLTFVGCGSKAKECMDVINTIDDDDAALKGINFSVSDFKALGKSVGAAADAVDKVATDLAAKKVTDAELSKESADYQAFAKELAKALRDFAGNLQQLGDTLDKMAPMVKSFTSGMDKLKKKCAAPDKTTQADCNAIKTAMKDAPDQDAFLFDADLKDDAAAFAKFAGELKALQLTNADMKSALDEVAKGIDTLKDVMNGLSDLKPKFDANQTAIKAGLAKEEPIERHINQTCGAK